VYLLIFVVVGIAARRGKNTSPGYWNRAERVAQQRHAADGASRRRWCRRRYV